MRAPVQAPTSEHQAVPRGVAAHPAAASFDFLAITAKMTVAARPPIRIMGSMRYSTTERLVTPPQAYVRAVFRSASARALSTHGAVSGPVKAPCSRRADSFLAAVWHSR